MDRNRLVLSAAAMLFAGSAAAAEAPIPVTVQHLHWSDVVARDD
jgi:hypothetical protein